MTNKELQDKLAKLPPNANVCIETYDYEGSRVFTTPLKDDVSIDKDGDVVICAL